MEFQAQQLRDASSIVVFSGAGISAESGIPTFRDALTGLWERFDPVALATAQAFRNNPALVWGWYEWRRAKVLAAQPNAAHLAIAKLATRVPKLTVVTQNVDDLLERAGCPDVLHLHGSLGSPRCFACARPYEFKGDQLDEPEEGRSIEPPRCLHCNGKVRPGVVWFGESLPDDVWRTAVAAARDCDLLLSVGTSGLVQPAAEIPQIALQHGSRVVHINVQPEAVVGEREFNLVGKAAEVLPRLVEQAFG
ncbi:NAD-dependent protein deacylase [Pseudomonas akapageensis]|uniref:NAD-dependent protein deacylase n=1 Tax=Pseudomonas akapageensis TaxID=2609961 RepID=UPI0014093C86